MMKKYDLIYFVGDSWTIANNTDGVLAEPQPINTLFTYLVANHFNVPYKVTAQGGASNTWIMRQVYDNLPDLCSDNKQILCIVAYSCPTREELYFNSTQTIETLNDKMCSKEFYQSYITEHLNFNYSNMKTSNIIKSVRALSNTLSVDLIEAFAFTDVLNVEFLNNRQILEQNFRLICGDEGRIYNPKTGGHGHQNQLGNRKIADALIQKINEVYGTN